MTIDEFIWPQERIEHIARHGVTPEEVEEVCFGKALVQRAKSEGANPGMLCVGPNLCGALRVLCGYPVSGRQGVPRDCSPDDSQGETSLAEMERPMKKSGLPKTDSITKLAEFWDSHDVTDFEGELEVVSEPVFVRTTAIKVPLEAHEAEAVERIAQAKGVSREELVRAWVSQKVASRNNARRTKR
jgi:hypothetical protein